MDVGMHSHGQWQQHVFSGPPSRGERLLARKSERLTADDPEYLTLVRLQMAFVDHMRRIYTLAKRIAKDILPAALAKAE